MKIGDLRFSDPFLSLAPLAGYGDVAFRRLCRDFGASLTVSEMVSAKGLVYGGEKTASLLTVAPNETPSCVQLFGADPEFFYRASALPAVRAFDCIDINMGCPVPKVTKNGEGSALMRNADLAAEIVRACREGSGLPVTVKIRLGWDGAHIVAPAFAAKMQEAGAAAITVHGRTTEQGYSGVADWNAIAEVARAVSVPVIGNGDIRDRESALFAMEKYNVAGVAIGRGALGNPQVFAAGPARESLHDTICRHLDYMTEYFPEAVAVRSFRKHVCRYLSGVAGTKELRNAINYMTTAQEVKNAVKELPHSLSARSQ